MFVVRFVDDARLLSTIYSTIYNVSVTHIIWTYRMDFVLLYLHFMQFFCSCIALLWLFSNVGLLYYLLYVLRYIATPCIYLRHLYFSSLVLLSLFSSTHTALFWCLDYVPSLALYYGYFYSQLLSGTYRSSLVLISPLISGAYFLHNCLILNHSVSSITIFFYDTAPYDCCLLFIL